METITLNPIVQNRSSHPEAWPATETSRGSLGLQLFLKKTLALVFSSEFCEVSKNTFFNITHRDDCFCQKFSSQKIIDIQFTKYRWRVDIYQAKRLITAWKVLSKYEAFFGTYFLVFSPNARKYGPEKTLLKVWHRCFTVNFAKFLKTSFFIEHLWTLFTQWMALELDFWRS